MVYHFSNYELDTALFALRREGQTVGLRPKAYQLLLYLLENRERVVSKQALCDAVWPGRFISDGTLESTILAVRRALGDKPDSPHFIQTVRTHGYRFVAEVAEKSVARAHPDRPETPPDAPADIDPWLLAPLNEEAPPPLPPPPALRQRFNLPRTGFAG
jgi:DNA-binding winged helix-turn-helix (wHTH) protein